MANRIVAWCVRNLPTRESLKGNRLLRPVAHRVLAPELWRPTRRSVPRGVALGMVTGILAPVAQIAISALLALPIRANIPAAALTTFLTNPVTTPPLWIAAYWIGRWVLHFDSTVGSPIAHNVAANQGWLEWLMGEAAPATMVGLLMITTAAAILGYALTTVGWRFWVARKWRQRRRLRG